MIEFKFVGRIDSFGELKEGVSKSGKDWKRLDFVCVVPDGRHEDRIAVSASNDVAMAVSKCELGEDVSVRGYIYAREYNGRYYNNLDVAEIHRKGEAKAQEAATAAAQDGNEDLPF